MKLTILSIITILVFLYFDLNGEEISKVNIQDFQREIPIDDRGNEVISYKSITKRTELLKLSSIKKWI
jgi:tartrate dehydratase beta subunit/fumarate hydratase class I family protein